ncbi:MAG: branched-chain amino acid transport system II carrier protein [Cruoricaptor ignavus]|nr:branched-chain amino acid transport system II carrier protein [Cruoricaptor ignavus]
MNKKIGIEITLGFALFAMFFGAGNLVLPPFIGLKTGSEWLPAIAGFLTTGIVAPFLGVLAVAKHGNSFTDFGKKVNPTIIMILAFFIMLCIGPLVAIPRTASTTYEVGILPSFPKVNNVLFSIIFFIVIYFLTVSKSKIVDIIGNYLTPFLMVCLGILVVVGVLKIEHPSIVTGMSATESYVFAFLEGYQTLDVLASVAFAGIIINAAIAKGYTNHEERYKVTFSAGLISMVALFIIYGGLIYLGAHTGLPSDETISRTDLLLQISKSVLGESGTLVVSVAIALACITTAIALASAMGGFLEELTKGKLKYSIAVLLTCLLACYLSVRTVDEIIEYAVVILGFVYPITFSLILTILFFGKKIRTQAPYIATIIVSAFFALLSVFSHFGLFTEPINALNEWLPFSEHQLEWFVPSLLAFFITAVLGKGRTFDEE